MNADDELASFVRESLLRGVPRAAVGEALAAAGWRPDQVGRALGAYADVAFPVPVPRPRPYLSAREAFLYLLLFTALWISAFNLGSLLFAFIDRAWPDPAMRDHGTRFRDSVRWSVANLVVAFPLYGLLSLSLQRAIDRDPARRGSRVRKWLTYLTLFAGAGVLVGDVIALVHRLLQGELTTRFVLKVVVVAAIAGIALGYHLWDIRQDEAEGRA